MSYQSQNNRQLGFTVVELLIVMMILGLMVAMSMSALNAAVAQARISRTKVVIAKLDQLIMDRWEGFRTRPVPIRATAGANVRTSTTGRLNALREIMRLELPCSKEDVTTNPTYVTRTSLSRGYFRKAPTASWTDTWEEAECLYLIIASMRDNDKSALDFFTVDEIGDIDGDGIPEIHDAWGQPIMFLRAAPGYRLDATVPALSMQNSNTPDGFDLLKADSRWADTDQTNNPFDLKPLIYSFGPDKNTVGIQLPDFSTAAALATINDPYRLNPSGFQTGLILSTAEVGDNITNHYQEAE